MIKRSDYGDLNADELRQLIKRHKIALKILQSMYGEHRAEHETISDFDVAVDIIISSLGYEKHDILFEDSKLLGKAYLSDTNYKSSHGKRSIELIATAIVGEVLDYHCYNYDENELLSVFSIDKIDYIKEKANVREYANTVYWKSPSRR